MNLWHVLDVVLITSVVSLCLIYVVYALSPVGAKRVMLSWLIKCIGLKAFGWLSPNPGGCDHCAGSRPLKFRKP